MVPHPTLAGRPADPPGALRALAASGVPALTGWPDGPPVTPPYAVATRLGRLAERIASLSAGAGTGVDLGWGRLLTGRAALLGLRRAGTTSANRSCRLVRSADGWVALNLPRPEDVASLPALLAPAGVHHRDVDADDPWPAVAVGARRLTGAALVEQATLLGVPAGVLRPPPVGAAAYTVEARWPPLPPRPLGSLRVVDLSSMWAGPLATRILAAAGATVTKVELAGRPDGARRLPEMYSWLHQADQEQVTVDVSSRRGRGALLALLAGADIVVESSRPRALAHLGAGPDAMPERSGRVWLAVSGHGRGAGANRVGFGDDAAVAGGLVGWSGPGRPVFLADAVADPVTGMVAAAAVLDALAAGGGALLDVALSSAAAWLASGARWGHPPASPEVRSAPAGGWELAGAGVAAAVLDPVPAAPFDPVTVGPFDRGPTGAGIRERR
ncbi:CoA transferase [Acidiferrimicrobium sp. IK]|uniref:CoA transferase n=1 Tax=Acidiferrimicrobium sp. IK TaxID=2871700 RepID=UPI0021CB62E9|nr:CoA transferase [Acidiferrimicrobium sp. IK]MCU4185309.1 CoA transferase [Acidiferrimicrobium sp. IK]